MSWGNVPIDQEKVNTGEIKKFVGFVFGACQPDKGNQFGLIDSWITEFNRTGGDWTLISKDFWRVVNRLDVIQLPHLQQKEVTQTPNLEEIKKKFYEMMEKQFHKDFRYVVGDYGEFKTNTSDITNFFVRVTESKGFVKLVAPLLATKEHDVELLKEFQSWFNDREEWAFDDTCVIDDVTLALFIASRKVSSSGEGK